MTKRFPTPTAREQLKIPTREKEILSANDLKPATTALLFFDMLNGHINTGDAATTARYAPVIVAASALLTAARAHRMMIAYAGANHRADNATTAHTIRGTDGRLRPLDPALAPSFKPVVVGGTWEAAVIDELAPATKDYVIVSAFSCRAPSCRRDWRSAPSYSASGVTGLADCANDAFATKAQHTTDSNDHKQRDNFMLCSLELASAFLSGVQQWWGLLRSRSRCSTQAPTVQLCFAAVYAGAGREKYACRML